MLKIYLAASYKEEGWARDLFEKLICEGFAVSYFIDVKPINIQNAFIERKEDIDSADVCILIVPPGRLVCMEAGYAKGRGKKLYYFGGLFPGEQEIIDGFADGMYGPQKREIDKLIAALIQDDMEKEQKSRRMDTTAG